MSRVTWMLQLQNGMLYIANQHNSWIWLFVPKDNSVYQKIHFMSNVTADRNRTVQICWSLNCRYQNDLLQNLEHIAGLQFYWVNIQQIGLWYQIPLQLIFFTFNKNMIQVNPDDFLRSLTVYWIHFNLYSNSMK